MSVEAYVVNTKMALDLTQQLAGIREMAEAWKGVATQLKDILELQKQVSAGLGNASSSFASGMASAATSAKEAAASVAQSSRAIAEAARSAPLQIGYDPNWRSTPNIKYGSGVAGGAYVPPQFQKFSGAEGYTSAGAEPYGTPDENFNGPSAGDAGGGGRNGQRPINLYDPLGERPGYGDYMMAGYGAQMVGGAAGGWVDSSFMAAASKDQILGQMKAQGFTDKQATDAYAAAVKTQQTVMGTYINKNLELVVKLMGLTQDAGLAVDMLPEMARAQQVFAGMGRNGEKEIYNAMRAGELRGVLYSKDASGKEVPNLPAIQKFLQNMQALTTMSGGNYGPSDILGMMKSGGIAAGIMTDENGFAEMMPFIQSMGPQRAGTALRAFAREFPGGRMSDAAFNILTDMGIIEKPGRALKAGIGYHQLLPGAMGQGDFDEATNTPLKFIMDRLLPKVQAYDRRYYGKDYTNADETKKLSIESVTMGQVASMIPGGVFMSEMLRLNPLVLRDVEAFKKQAGGDAYENVVAKNPLMQLEALRAGVNAMMITTGSENMQVSLATMKALTAALNAMSNTLSANPKMGADLMLVADALKVIAPVIGAFMVLLPAISAAKKIGGWVGGGLGLGGAGAAGADTLLGKAIPLVGEGLLAKDIIQHDRKDETGLVNQTKLLIAGMEKMLGMNITVKAYLNGKEIGAEVAKEVVNGVGGPRTDSGDLQLRDTFTMPSH